MISAICIVPVAPVRREPSHASEMTSQLLFGEGCVVLASAGNGAFRIRCLHDGYEGYCMANQLMRAEDISGDRIFKGWSNTVVCPDGTTMQVPFGASFPPAVEGLYRLPGEGVPGAPDVSLSAAFSLYLNTPYVWGGRSVFGADCSGFTQTVMKARGMSIPRDASQQVELGWEIGLTEAVEGDLAFFELEGRVVHVGFCLGSGGIIHAYGSVRKDGLDQRGIFNTETGAYSHSLYKVKRLM